MDYKDFHRYCVTRPGQLALNCGSSWELPIQYVILNPTDLDRMFFRTEQCAIPPGRAPPKWFKGTLLIIDGEGNHPGFTKLRRHDPCHNKSYFTWPVVILATTVVGVALESHRELSPTLQVFLGGNTRTIKQDDVYAIQCPYWPLETNEWRLRRRNHGWPDQKLINRIVRGGCHFVAKKHPKTTFTDDTEWRFSFSRAELLLVHSWSPVQKYVYHRLRIIKSKVISECGGGNQIFFHTYYFKTLMLWACEIKSPAFWEECNIGACIAELIADMIVSIVERNCPNYFIRDNNMMDHLEAEADLSKELQLFVIHAELNARNHPGFAFPTNPLLFQIPKGLLTWLAVAILDSEYAMGNKLKQVLKSYVFDSKQFMPEIKFLYEGINESLRLVQSLNDNCIRECGRELAEPAFRCFDSAISCNDTVNSWSVVSFDKSVYENIEQLIWDYITNKSSIASIRRHKTPAESSIRADWSIVYDRFSCNENIENVKCWYKNKNGLEWLQFPAQLLLNRLRDNFIPPLYAVASAYRANVMFTVLGDYASTCDVCDRVFGAFQRVNDVIGDADNLDLFPVIICNKWSALFDEHLQIILGFATLNEASLSGSKPKDVVLALSSLEMLKYLKSRCLGKQVIKHTILQRFAKHHEEQPCASRYVRRSAFSTVLFRAALYISIGQKKLSS